MQTEGVGYDDLNILLKNPADLQFTIGHDYNIVRLLDFIWSILELLGVEQPEEYEKESWQLTEVEKLKKVPELREKGNVLFRENKHKEAEQQYATAIGFLEQLMLQLSMNSFSFI